MGFRLTLSLTIRLQLILVASLDPIWVKIGIRSTNDTESIIRTWRGTERYIAPEFLGLFHWMPGIIVSHASDAWSLGSLVHQMLTSESPFTHPAAPEWIMSGLPTELRSRRGTDMSRFEDYCRGLIQFPTEILRSSRVDEEGVAFVKNLLTANPKDRPTATDALRNPWLLGSQLSK